MSWNVKKHVCFLVSFWHLDTMPMLNPCRDVWLYFFHLWWSFFFQLVHYGDSAAVTLIVIFIDSAISINFELANSLPLSVKNFSGAPYIFIQDLKIVLRMICGPFYLTKRETDNPLQYIPVMKFPWGDLQLVFVVFFDTFGRMRIYNWLPQIISLVVRLAAMGHWLS